MHRTGASAHAVTHRYASLHIVTHRHIPLASPHRSWAALSQLGHLPAPLLHRYASLRAVTHRYTSLRSWDIFPRPYCISSLPHRDITMQGDPKVGDFRHYQGVWRLQELPGCAPEGSSAMRLTYSVELSPRAWVPVALLEGRIAEALGDNLEAIRNYVARQEGCFLE